MIEAASFEIPLLSSNPSISGRSVIATSFVEDESTEDGMVTSVHVVCVLGNIRGQFINILVRYGHQGWVGQCGITIMPVAFSSAIFCNTWLIMQKGGNT
jgi:hypothetical protein